MNNYVALKEKLMSSFSQNVPIQNITELEEKMQFLISKFTIASDKKEIDKLLKEKLVPRRSGRKIKCY